MSETFVSRRTGDQNFVSMQSADQLFGSAGATGAAFLNDTIALMMTPECAALRHAFFAERAASKIPDVPEDTPVRAVIHAATRRLKTPTTLVALIVEGHDLAGVLIGDIYETWRAAADVSSQRHIQWCDRPYKRVLSGCPPMYDELWTAGKCMYKMEPVVEVGGELIIYAPHLSVVSHVHGKYIYEAGYHILPYFLENWESYKHLPLGALAHCTHVRGSGVMENGVEKPNVRLLLASQIPPEECAKLNLGYMDPAAINPAEWEGREDEGILYVPKAGERLYKVR